MPKRTDKISKSAKDTEKIARAFLAGIMKIKSKNNRAVVVGLSGELGTGKTAFTQSVAKSLGVKRKVNSPTFVIMKRYPLKHEKYEFLFHLDAYRLKNEKELLHLGWEEIIADKTHLIFIEWPEHVAKIMPKNSHFVRIFHAENGHRKFKIEGVKML